MIIDPDATLDYAFDWSAWLDTGETISSHTLVPTSGLTVNSSTENAGIITAWVSASVEARSLQRITCRVVTNEGRTDDRTMQFRVTDR